MAQTGIRDYLRSRGLNDDEITYDNGTVYAKGRRFIDSTPQSDNKTYADSRALDNAYGDYDVRDQLAQLRTRSTQPNQQLTSMQQAIQERLDRPTQQFSYNAESDPQYQAALRTAQQNAQTAGNNAMVALGSRGIGNSSITGDRVAQIQQREVGNVTSNVLPQLINQAYQRYMGQQQLDNQQLGNMMQYADYLNRNDQQQFRNAYDLLSQQNTMNQQDRDNQYRTEALADKQKQDRINQAQWGISTYGYGEAKMDPQVFFDQYKGATPLAVQQIALQKAMQEAGVTGKYNGQDTMAQRAQDFNQKQAMEQLAISRMNAGTSAMSARNSAGNASFNRLMDVWKATGKAPAGLEGLGVQPGTAFADAKQGAKLDKEMQGLFSGLTSGQIDSAKAMDEIKVQLAAGVYTPTEAAAMTNLVQQFANNQPQKSISPLSPSQTKQLEDTGQMNYQSLSQKELEKAWQTDPTGKSSGAPMMDWSAWVRDPRGRMAGTSFNAYQSAYGARLGR